MGHISNEDVELSSWSFQTALANAFPSLQAGSDCAECDLRALCGF